VHVYGLGCTRLRGGGRAWLLGGAHANGVGRARLRGRALTPAMRGGTHVCGGRARTSKGGVHPCV
jgi:hypothetical protein